MEGAATAATTRAAPHHCKALRPRPVQVSSKSEAKTGSSAKTRAATSARTRAWPQVIPFFAFPPDVRRLIYTTNSLESVHARLGKII